MSTSSGAQAVVNNDRTVVQLSTADYLTHKRVEVLSQPAKDAHRAFQQGILIFPDGRGFAPDARPVPVYGIAFGGDLSSLPGVIEHDDLVLINIYFPPQVILVQRKFAEAVPDCRASPRKTRIRPR